MRISVVIPTYNSAATIKSTLSSVLSQTLSPDEILVLDDGSSDETVTLLKPYRPLITILQQSNTGVATTRNILCQRAQGDLVAFLDHDDIWHPRYLEEQSRLFTEHPSAAALFTGHVDFSGFGTYQWDRTSEQTQHKVEVISPVEFFSAYTQKTGSFASMSYCCIPKAVLSLIGTEPFVAKVTGADDACLFSLLPLLGRPVVLCREPLVAYRMTACAQSADLLGGAELWIKVFEALRESYCRTNRASLRRSFERVFASKKRQYAKLLMGSGERRAARAQIWSALGQTIDPMSAVKSLSLLSSTYLPAVLQPRWPSRVRTLPAVTHSCAR